MSVINTINLQIYWKKKLYFALSIYSQMKSQQLWCSSIAWFSVLVPKSKLLLSLYFMNIVCGNKPDP